MKKRALPLLFAALKFLSGFALVNAAYDLHRDEYLHLDLGRHLARGYLEVPPLIALQAWLSQMLGGGDEWVHVWPLLWGGLTVYLVGRTVQRLGGGWFAVSLASVGLLVSGYARLNLLFQPNSFEVFGFTFCLYALIRFVQGERPIWLYAMGAGLGLGLLNKYTTLFFIAALLVGLAATPLRRLFGNRHLYGAAGLALVLWLPNLSWQIEHGIPFLHHMSELNRTQLVHVSPVDFWKEQLLMCFPALWIWLPGLIAVGFAPIFKPYRVVAVVFTVGLLILTVLHGKGYYALGYYPLLFSFGAVWLDHRLGSSRFAAFARPVLVALPLLIALSVIPFLVPVLAPDAMQAFIANAPDLGLTRWEDGERHELPQDYADMRGWREMADKVTQLYRSLPDSARLHTLILCGNYGQAGAINHYGRDLPEALTFSGSHLYWFSDDFASSFTHLIWVDDNDPGDLSGSFASFTRAATVNDPYARERGTVILLGVGPTPAFRDGLAARHRRALAEWEGQR